MKNHRSDIEYVIPNWTDPKRQGAILKNLLEYATEMGFKPEELKDMRDRRLLLLTYKAMLLDDMVEKNAKGGK